MQKLSQATETKMLSAIADSAEHVNAGLSPSAAIAKSAQAHGIGPGYIDLMVHAYNTGRTNRQRQEGSTFLEKIADFELADSAEVKSIMFPATVKSAMVQVEDRKVSPAYGFSPEGMLGRRASFEKAARAVPPLVFTPAAPYPTDPTTQIKKAAAEVERLKYAVEESRREMRAAFDKTAAVFGKLAEYFRKPEAVPLPVVKANVAVMHGRCGEAVLDRLIEGAPSLMKLGTHLLGESAIGPRGQLSFDAYVSRPAVGEPYDLVQEVLTGLDTYHERKSVYEKCARDNAERTAAVLRPFVQPACSGSILDQSSTDFEKAGINPLQALGYGALLTTTVRGLGQGIKAPDEGAAVQKNLNALTDPEHEGKLRAINTQAMLQNFMLNDPVISSHDPDSVLDAFNEITQVAPHAADQSMLMQSLLRSRLQQGATDPFQIDQMLGMEDKLRKRDMPQKPGGGDAPVI